MNIHSCIKILVGYHKPFKLFKNEILVPIHGGRACPFENSKDGLLNDRDFKWLLNNTIGDDTGDNLSIQNRYINEMSAIYWGWKNYSNLGNPDYIGFMQYGKHLIFNPYAEISKEEFLPNSSMFLYPEDDYVSLNNLAPEIIENAVIGYDCLCAEKYDIKNCSVCQNCYERLNELSHGCAEETFKIMCQTIRKKFPDFSPYINDIEMNSVHYPLNIFVMKKEMFFQYCEFVFTILKEILNGIHLEKATPLQKRAPAFCSEFLTSIFISASEKRFKIKTCKTAVIKEAPHDIEKLLKFFQENILRKKHQKYNFLSKITFGKKKKKYRSKSKEAKSELRKLLCF